MMVHISTFYAIGFFISLAFFLFVFIDVMEREDDTGLFGLLKYSVAGLFVCTFMATIWPISLVGSIVTYKLNKENYDDI